jgi:hypothetical protein
MALPVDFTESQSMMIDAINPVKVVNGAVCVIDDDGNIVGTFRGHDLSAWRQFQVAAVRDLNVVVTDNFMPREIAKTIKGPDGRADKFVPSG